MATIELRDGPATIELAEDRTVCLAGLPQVYMVVPDPWQGTLVSATSQAGPAAGLVSPDAAAQGRLIPVQSGVLSDAAVDVTYELATAGGVETAEFVWREKSGSGYFFGKDDPRHMWGFHAPFDNATPGSQNASAAYSAQYRRLLTFGIVTTTLYIRYRDIDSARYDQWTQTTATLRTAVASGVHNLATCDLPDGRILAVVRIPGVGGPTYDFDVYQSADGGLTWRLVSRRIIFRFLAQGASYPTHSLTVQIRVARAGEYIRLVWGITTVGHVATWLSRDRGITWKSIDDDDDLVSAYGPVTDASDTLPFDLVGLDDSGTFVLAAGAPNQTVIDTFQTTGELAWGTAFHNLNAISANAKMVTLIRHPLWIYLVTFMSDEAPGNGDEYQLYRFKPVDFADFTKWQTGFIGTVGRRDGTQYNPGRVKGVWAGSSFFYYGGRKGEALGADQTLGMGWYSEAWTVRPLGDSGPGTRFYWADRLWDVMWAAPDGRPTGGGTTTWTATTVGTGSDNYTADALEIIGAAAADQKYYQHGIAGSPIWYNDGGIARFVARLDTGDSSSASANVAVRIIAADLAGANKYDFEIRIGPANVILRDLVAGTNAITLSSLSIDTGATGAYHQFLVWKVGTAVQMAIYSYETKTWSIGNGTISTLAGAGFVSSIRFGHVGQVQATQMRSWWREVTWTEDGTKANQTSNLPVAAGGDVTALFGASAAPVPQYVEQGVQVAWAGAGGQETDSWTGAVAHAYPAEAVFVDSPRIAWRSVGVANQSIIFDVGSSAHRWRHDAIALFACNNRYILIDYDDASTFASPTSTETIDLTAFGTAELLPTVSALSGNTMTISGSANPWVAGELVGYYIRMTSGTGINLTFRITRHPADNIVQCDDESSTLASQGVAVADGLVIFSPAIGYPYNAAVAKRYLRIRCQDVDTAEGYHQIGTAIPGRILTFDVPLDWALTDDDEPNVSTYRTKSGIAWAFPEGPPQRQIKGRVVGDADRWRDRFRAMMRQFSYEGRVSALILDAERPANTAICGRITSGSALDQAGYYRDDADDIRAAGDLSLTFVEEP